MNTIVLDIGGSALKIWTPGSTKPIKVETGDDFSGGDFVRTVRETLGDSPVDRISIGYPGLVRWGRPVEEPVNLGGGWVDLDYAQEFDCPVRILNDADMQALGGYAGGRMLYLGLGTGVGTSLVVDGVISPLALGLLPFKDGKRFDEFLTKEGLEQIGLEQWREAVAETAALFKDAMLADYVLLGGSGAERFETIPPGCRRGSNANAYFGGLRMWEDYRAVAI
jgi:hypothetical protein